MVVQLDAEWKIINLPCSNISFLMLQTSVCLSTKFSKMLGIENTILTGYTFIFLVQIQISIYVIYVLF